MQFDHVVGVTLALIAMALYGLYMAPRRKTKITNELFSFWMGCGILFSTQLLAFDSGFPTIAPLSYLVILLCGIIWGTGTAGYSYAVQTIGLSRSTPIKNLCAIFAALLGIFVLHEIDLGNFTSLGLILCGSVVITISASLLSRLEAPDSSFSLKPCKRTLIIGILCAFWAAIAYSIYTVPMKILLNAGLSPSAFLLYMGHGCFIGMALPLIFKPGIYHPVSRGDMLLAMSAGAMWAIGSLCANIAVKLIGVAITWPLTKTTLIAVIYGAFVLREIDIKRHRCEYISGVLLSVLGVVLLAIAATRS